MSSSHFPRVLLITNIFPPQIGGPATFMSHLASQLTATHGARVSVVCSSAEGAERFDVSCPYRVVRLPRLGGSGRRIQVPLLLARELSTNKRVLVNGLESVVYPLARALGRRYVVKVVGDSVWQGARNTGETDLTIDEFQQDAASMARYKNALRLRRSMLTHAHLVITPSEYLKGLVIAWGIPEAHVRVIENGVEAQECGRAASTRGEGEPLRALFVGRLTNWKGVDTLLLAVARTGGVVATIAGDGPEYPALKALSVQLGLADRVRFAGRLTASQVASEMASAHTLILTSLYEGMSHTLLEAMAAGLPCIASDCGGNREVIRADSGILIPPMDVASLSDSLLRLRDDEPMRVGMAHAARARAASFSMSRAALEYASLLVGA